ncbi:Nicotinamide-nucleotide adenylyltransferase [Aphelenchoides bicaudatus]|nr:Nicotinamide-nucleotide adenylyltransferase [Aphelenchoides bicaudatus]
MMLISLGDHKFYSMLDQMQVQSIFSPYMLHKNPKPLLSRLNGQQIVLVSIGKFNPANHFNLRMFERARDYIEKTLGHSVFEAVFSPFSSRFGQSTLISNDHRIRMLELATQDSDWIGVSNWQCRQQTPQNYLKVLQHLREEYTQRLGPNSVQLVLVCGSDFLDALSMPNFYIDRQEELSNEDIEDIVANYGLIALTRPNTSPYKAIYSSDILRKYEKNIYVINDEVSLSSLSSNRLRMAIRRGESVRYCMSDNVIEYICRHNLYKSTFKRPIETRQESVESVSLDELLELSNKWVDYFKTQIDTGFMLDSTQSLPNTTRSEYPVMHTSSPAVLTSSPPQSPRPTSKNVHFNLNSRGNTASEPLPRKAVRLKFRQFNLSGTPETTL